MTIIHKPDARFEASADVVVVGAGACGFTAALAAADGGAEVMLLERDERPSGSTGMSQGYVCASGTKLQRAAGIEDNPDIFFDDIVRKTQGKTDLAFARTIAEESAPTIDWLAERHDIPFDINPGWVVFGHSRPRMHGMPGRRGTELVATLSRAADAAGVLTSTNARVVDLYVGENQRVIGVGVQRPDGRLETVGCGALVLATCGFGANRQMVAEHITHMSDAPYFGHEGNQGDGILWGQALGAAVADMAAYQGYGALTDPYGVLMNYDAIMYGGFCVNTKGDRFSHELEDISGQGEKVIAQPGNCAWVIYGDQQEQRVAKLPEYRDLLELGAVKKADSVDDLAKRINVDAEALARTFDDVARSARTGEAAAFGRRFKPEEAFGPAYRAVKVKGALFHTQGGLVVDRKAQVLREDGRPLPNLFAGGGAARSISGPGVWGYLPAAGLCMATTLGRLAGASAAQLVRQRENA